MGKKPPLKTLRAWAWVYEVAAILVFIGGGVLLSYEVSTNGGVTIVPFFLIALAFGMALVGTVSRALALHAEALIQAADARTQNAGAPRETA